MRHPVYSRICLCIVRGQGKTIRTRFLTKFICSTALALSMWAHCLSSQCCVRFRNASSLQFWQHWKTTASLVSTERQQCAVICFRCPTAHIVEGDLVTKTRLKSTTRKPLCSTLFFLPVAWSKHEVCASKAGRQKTTIQRALAQYFSVAASIMTAIHREPCNLELLSIANSSCLHWSHL